MQALKEKKVWYNFHWETQYQRPKQIYSTLSYKMHTFLILKKKKKTSWHICGKLQFIKLIPIFT